MAVTALEPTPASAGHPSTVGTVGPCPDGTGPPLLDQERCSHDQRWSLERPGDNGYDGGCDSRHRCDLERRSKRANPNRIMTQQFDTRLEPDTLRIELFVCASMYGTYEKQNDVIQRIQRLVDRDRLAALSRYTWARELSPAAEDTWCEFAREKYDEFTRWAVGSNRSLEPAFSRRTVRNEYLDECYDVIQFPIISIAVYDDDALVRLAPSVDDDGEAYTIEDCLTELEQLDRASVTRAQQIPEP